MVEVENGNTNNQAQKDEWHFRFTNHTPAASAVKKIEGLRRASCAMADAIIDMCPPSREQSLALTHLETMLMYSVAAIARTETKDNPDFVDPDEQDQNGEK